MRPPITQFKRALKSGDVPHDALRDCVAYIQSLETALELLAPTPDYWEEQDAFVELGLLVERGEGKHHKDCQCNNYSDGVGPCYDWAWRIK